MSKKRCRYFSWLIYSCEHYCQLAQLLEHTGSKNSKARWGIEHDQLRHQGQQLSVGLSSLRGKPTCKRWVYCGLINGIVIWSQLPLLAKFPPVAESFCIERWICCIRRTFMLIRCSQGGSQQCFLHRVQQPYKHTIWLKTEYLTFLHFMVSKFYRDVVMNW